jgi:hypothetical protein
MDLVERLNGYTGLLLLLICAGVWAAASRLARILREIECLHQDYDATTEAHEQLHWKRQAKANEYVSKQK